MDVEARLNEVADHLAHEGLTYRASRVREGAVEIARHRHRIERLEAPWRAVDDLDWDYIMSAIGDGGRDQFWKAVLYEMRAALARKEGP